MSVCCNLSRDGKDFLSTLSAHNCRLCEKCLICHHCLLARAYLRNAKIGIPEEYVSTVLDAISKNLGEVEDSPRYIFVGENNEIIEKRPVQPKNKPNNTDQEQIGTQNTIPIEPNVEINVQEETSAKFSHHVDLQSLLEPYKCKLCGDSFKGGTDLLYHTLMCPGKSSNNQEAVHENIPDEQFDPVEMIFVDELGEPSEIILEPTIINCDQCEKTFTSSNDLELHKIYHSVEQPHECKACNVTFKYSHELIKHSLYHDPKPFKCDYCEKGFDVASKLDIHMRIHADKKPFKCDVCGKSFRQNYKLKYHMITHSDKRPFKCDVCPKAFKIKNKLDQHNMIHKGIMRFACTLCERNFRHKCNLKTHCLKHHGKTLNESGQIV